MKPKELQRRNDEDLRAVLEAPAGRRFIFRILTQAGLYSSSYAESPTATAFNEGRRSVALALLAEAQRVAPELYTRALREELDSQEEEALERQRAEEAAAGSE